MKFKKVNLSEHQIGLVYYLLRKVREHFLLKSREEDVFRVDEIIEEILLRFHLKKKNNINYKDPSDIEDDWELEPMVVKELHTDRIYSDGITAHCIKCKYKGDGFREYNLHHSDLLLIECPRCGEGNYYQKGD